MAFGKPAVATLMASKGRQPGISEEERATTERRRKVEEGMAGMFEERAKDPFAYVMPLEEQKYYDKRRLKIYGEERGRQQQSLMGAMNRTGTLASGATNYNLMRFGQETLRDQQQFYFQDQATRLQQREQAYSSTIQSGAAITNAPVIGAQETDAMNARARQHNEWRNRWANIFANTGYA